FFCARLRPSLALLSFPTRRSSDLVAFRRALRLVMGHSGLVHVELTKSLLSGLALRYIIAALIIAGQLNDPSSNVGSSLVPFRYFNELATAVPAVVAKELDLFGIVGPVNSVLEPNHTARNENSLVPAVLLAGRAHCQRQCIVSASKFDHNHTSKG